MHGLNVYFLPRHVDPQQLAGGTCAVIDVLRATTTIAYALEAGAKEIIPCLDVDEARRIAATLPAGTFLLGGERGGQKIDGFDLGNSPAEYTKQRVENKSLVFTTTNGTRAMLLCACAGAGEVLLGSLVNAEALAEQLARRACVHLVCAGTDGQISREDVLAAGAITARMTSISAEFICNDEALIAADAWRSIFTAATMISGAADLRNDLEGLLRDSRGGRNLIALGMQEDLAIAADFCLLATVPIFRDGRITRLAATDFP